ncbi:uncharacterized protein [Typha angustifolia]|uniref:uncharacterized protein n=1 Tax=Typha angustifolia TaxID=59011 RepID=UPI003C2F8745
MKKLCPNWDREDGLDTVLEVPIPEPDETFLSTGSSKPTKSWRTNMKAWLRFYAGRHAPYSLDGEADLQLMLGVVSAPLAPLPIEDYQTIAPCDVKEGPLTESMAKYILRQYVAAVGGEKALSSMSSMYAMGKVMMKSSGNGSYGHGKGSRVNFSGGEMGGFVLWQKKPEMWCMELVVAGCKISAGSDGKVAWRQTPWQQRSHAFRGPPRPLRRFLQGLDPISTATLFSHAACVGEKAINGDDCFVLHLDASPAALRARGRRNADVVRHTVRGYFSQRTGLLVQIEDAHLVQIKDPSTQEIAYWETNTESFIDGYRMVDGVHVAHSGRTTVSLVRAGEKGEGRTKSMVEETWNIEEVEFNVMGLSLECFLAPGDLEEEEEEEEEMDEGCDVALNSARPPLRFQVGGGVRIGPSQVAAVDSDS